MGCEVGSLSFTYLGLPIGCNMRKLKDWSFVVDKFNKKLSDWKAKTMSFGGRITLIKSVLSSLPLYAFSLFRAPSCTINSLEDFSNTFVRLISDGKEILFWKDKWLGEQSLCVTFDRLFRMDENKDVRIKDRIIQHGSSYSLNWCWNRTLTGRTATELEQLQAMLTGFKFADKENDSWTWSLSGSGISLQTF
ncbi:uncharacterized protein [Rutidosis leptorrhynchoides]|uniref:uncharacterized protein n=1 Tax=Rutidosis leptorrhynchoides TaxID=125765 RepID=UPI003A994730